MKRFWDKVNKNAENGCWEWTACLQNGYGYFRIKENNKRVMRFAHRISYEWQYGKFDESLFVCHKCDNPKCVNPDHLFLGTHNDNMDDMCEKGRHKTGNRKGILNGANRLNDDDIHKIRKMINGGLNNKQIAKKYNVHHSTISLIRLNKTWSHI